LVWLVAMICEVCRWNILRLHDLHTKFCEDWFRNPGNVKVTISIIWEAAMLVLLMGRFTTYAIEMTLDGMIYRVSQEERSIFWEVIVSVILSKEVYMYMCRIPNGFRERATSLYRRSILSILSPHTSYKVHWSWRWSFRKCIILGKLYQLCHLNNK
jgi:hypothetical protein